jgi:hypothetical protein
VVYSSKPVALGQFLVMYLAAPQLAHCGISLCCNAELANSQISVLTCCPVSLQVCHHI